MVSIIQLDVWTIPWREKCEDRIYFVAVAMRSEWGKVP